MSLVNNFKNFNNIGFDNFVIFKILNYHVGYVNKFLAAKIVNSFRNSFFLDNKYLVLQTLNGLEINFTNLTDFFNEIVGWLLNQQIIPKITKEYINVCSLKENQLLFQIERTAVHIFGIKAKGIHLNGYVIKDNKIFLWIAKRSKTKWFFPEKLDNIVAGAISIGYDAESTLLKEALEEANINATLLKKAQFINELHYLYLHNNTIRNDVMYIYNLELPIDFLPYQNDHEVASFTLMEASKVVDILSNSDKFKFNSALATMLFLLNIKVINSQNTSNEVMQAIITKFNEMAKKDNNIS